MPDRAQLVDTALRKLCAPKVKAGDRPTFTAEDLRPALEQAGINPKSFGPVFAGLKGRGVIRDTGETVNSSVAESKGRLLQVYEVTAQTLVKWGLAGPAPVPAAPRPNFVNGVKRLTAALRADAYATTEVDVANVLLCARAKPFLFLHGPTGTGKSLLPVLIAKHLSGQAEVVPVKPNWSDSSELLGYYSITKDEFVVGPLLRTVDAAIDNPTRLYVFVLDELNLARIEHYLSEILSIIETRRRTPDGIRTRPIPLEALPRRADKDESSGEDDAEVLIEYERLANLYLPANLLLVGTVNIDETTFNFSPKVLDRGFPVEMETRDLREFPSQSGPPPSPLPPDFCWYLFDPPGEQQVPISVAEAAQWAAGDDARAAVWNRVILDLVSLNGILRPGGFDISYRTRDAVCLYMDAWHTLGVAELLDYNSAFDLCIEQKILPKLRGNRSSQYEALSRLWEKLSATPPEGDVSKLSVPSTAPFPRSAARVLDMMRQYEDGSFSFWLRE